MIRPIVPSVLDIGSVAERQLFDGRMVTQRRFGLRLAREHGDGIYDVDGSLIRGGQGSKARFIGTQAEVVLEYEYSRN